MESWDQLGADSALLRDQRDAVVQVNFIEKILATVLSKVSNFIPEGGIWMNTQRPEWNDANNALVGNGVSAVTLYYLYRFLTFTDQLLRKTASKNVRISAELSDFLDSIVNVLDRYEGALAGNIDDATRKEILDGLGQAGSDYRLQIYADSFNGDKQEVSISKLLRLTELGLKYAGHAIDSNKRTDNLYHAYNIMSVKGDEVVISRLSEMLEGQVAVLSSGYLSSAEALEVLKALKASKIYREDQFSYILYPNKNLPGFMQKNNVPESSVANSSLLSKLVEDGDKSLIEQDVNGSCHFNGNFRNANDLKEALEELKQSTYSDLVEAESEYVLQVFEEVFNHKAFTGRSGTFFGYEGLGSIYWHMVSKLALAAQECCSKAIRQNEEKALIKELVQHYYEIVEGIGLHKSPELYGAFPTDPYSHTPAGKGAQQPGMTGQVKEDLLCRFGELGITVNDGRLGFIPTILNRAEFLNEAKEFTYIDVNAGRNTMTLEKNTLGFSYCQIPVVYKIGSEAQMEVSLSNGEVVKSDESYLNLEISKQVFERSGKVKLITATIKEDVLI